MRNHDSPRYPPNPPLPRGEEELCTIRRKRDDSISLISADRNIDVFDDETLMIEKSLDKKLASIHADPSGSKEFILADAKDADMALAIGATGRALQPRSADLPHRSLQDFREQIIQIVEQGLVDIMLMSASTNEALTIQQRLFDNSQVTPAARANDTTDIHVIRGAVYPSEPSLPFRTATLDHIQCGQLDCP